MNESGATDGAGVDVGATAIHKAVTSAGSESMRGA
jgi:hypothetical protein